MPALVGGVPAASVGNALCGVPALSQDDATHSAPGTPHSVPVVNSALDTPNSELADLTTDHRPLTTSPADTAFAALSTLRTTRPRDFYRRVAELGIQAAEALDHAHQMGIVHRDIKPSNLMVESVVSGQWSVVSDGQRTTDNGQQTTPKLWITDFGLARIQTDAGMTLTGDLLGTLRYMSPEQAEGKSAFLDHRTDIYSLGVTLYELLTLRPAFPADDRPTLLRQIANDEPTPPRKLNPSIPAELETILLKAIAKDPSERYATAGEFADDLGRFRDQKAIKAKPPTVWQRVNKLVRRHRAVAVWALLALILTTLGLSVSITLISRERDAAIAARDDERIARNDAEQERQRAEANYIIARQVVGQMLKHVASVRLDTIRDMKDVRRKLLEEAIVFYTKLIEISPGDAEAYRERAQVHQLLGKRPQSIADYEEAAKLKPNDAELRIALAGLYSAYGATRAELSAALVHALKAMELDQSNHLGLYFYARILANQGRSTEAREQLTRLEAIAPPTAEVYCHLSAAHSDNGDKELALQYARLAIESDPNNSKAHERLGTILFEFGLKDEALQAYNESLRLNPYQVSNGESAHWHRGDILVAQGRYAEALEDYDRAIDIGPWWYLPYKRRAVAHFHLKHYDQALADVTKAFELKPDDLSTLTRVDLQLIALCPDEKYRQGILKLLDKAILSEETSASARLERTALHDAMLPYEGISDRSAAFDAAKTAVAQAMVSNRMAWALVTSSNQKLRDGERAVQLAQKAVKLSPRSSDYLNTLGVAEYRAGSFGAAIESLTKSVELGNRTGYNFFFLAMAHWQLDEPEKGHEWRKKAIVWTEKNDPGHHELRRFRAEADELMGAASSPTDADSNGVGH